jgi:hypothetical protein
MGMMVSADDDGEKFFAPDTRFLRVEREKVYFKAGEEELNFTLPGTDSKLLGETRFGPKGEKVFWFSFISSSQLSAEPKILPFRGLPEKIGPITYPGRIIDRERSEVVHESRAFLGSCVQGRGELLIVFQRDRMDRKKRLQGSVLIIEPTSDGYKEELLTRHYPPLRITERLKKAGKCFEISGTHRQITAKLLRLNPKALMDEETEREKEESKDTEEKPDEKVDEPYSLTKDKT